MGKTRTKRDKSKKESKALAAANSGFDPDADVIYFDDNESFTHKEIGLGGDDGDETHSKSSSSAPQAAFFGLLDKDELEYFQTAESTLSVNALLQDEKLPFVTNVFEEAKGKELKLATSQICSKLIERLVLLASDQQLIDLFLAFSGHIFKLSLQKYSSHCLETLLVRFAGLIDRELLGTMKLNEEVAEIEGEPSAASNTHSGSSSPESLCLQLVSEIKPHLSQMAKDTYSSHVLRTILLVLGGEPMSEDGSLRSRKSKMARKHTELATSPEATTLISKRRVPSSFESAIKEIVKTIIADLDATSARRMSLDALGSPLLQVILQVSSPKSRSKLLDLILKGDGASGLWEHMLSNVTGSHFLRMVFQTASAKLCDEFYEQYFKSRIGKLASREHSTNTIKDLLQSKCTHKLEIVQAILESTNDIVAAEHFSCLVVALEIAGTISEKPELQKELARKVFTAVGDVKVLLSGTTIARIALTSAVLNADQGILGEFGDTLCGLSGEQLKTMALSPTESRLLQAALRPQMDLVIRRRLVNLFVPLVRELAVNANGSHIVDDLWVFSYKLKFVRERIAAELCKDEETLKASAYGKMVWRNWKLDKYVRARFEWWNLVKESEDSLRGFAPKSRATGQTEAPSPKSKKPQSKKPYDRPASK